MANRFGQHFVTINGKSYKVDANGNIINNRTYVNGMYTDTGKTSLSVKDSTGVKGALKSSPFFADVKDTSNAVSNAISNVASLVNSPSISSAGIPSASSVAFYPDAPLSTKYGMDNATAFGEEMANTAHQRNVADLKAAGLNPVLGISGSGASSVSGNSAVYSTIAPVGNSAKDVKSALSKVASGVIGLFAPKIANSASKIIEGLSDL